jgi:hypothetical protein
MSGEVYCCSNNEYESQSIFKVGGTSRNAKKRCKELGESTLLSSFRVIYSVHVPDWKYAEKCIHSRLAQYRVRSDREFFKVEFDDIKRAMDEIFFSVSNNLEGLLDLFYKYHLICVRTRSQSEAICKNRDYVLAKREKTYIQCCIDMIEHKTVLKESSDDYWFWKNIEIEDNPTAVEI